MSATASLARWRAVALPRLGGLLVLAEARLVAERGRLALWLPVAMGCGVLRYFALAEEPLWWPWALAVAPALALALWLARRHAHIGWAAGLVAAGLLGFAVAAWHGAHQPPALEPPRTAGQVSGRVALVEALPEGRRITLEGARFGEGEPVPRLVRFRQHKRDQALPAVGDRLSVRALVRAPAAPAFPGAWDFQRAAWFSGLGGSGFALGPVALERGEAPPLAGLRARIEASVREAMPGAAGAVAVALLTGAQTGITPEAMAAMRDSGLAHLLSVGGLHIAIVMGLGFAVARLGLVLWPWLGLRLPVKTLAALAGLALGAGYMLLTGAQVPMQRSFAMAALATLAMMGGRRAITLRAWAVAAAAVLALVAGWEALRPRLARWAPERPWLRKAALAGAGVVVTSVLAGAATTPFGLHHFGRLQLYGVAANAVAVPVTSVLVMPAGMLAVALLPLGLEGLALEPMRWGVEATLWVAREVAAWPGASRLAAPLPGWGLGLVSLGMLWLSLWRTGWRWWGVGLVALGMASSALERPPDILVSSDARLVAHRTNAGVWWQRASGANALVREMMLRRWGAAEATAFPPSGALPEGECRPGACVLHRLPEVVLLRGDPPWEACRHAALVLSAEPVRGRCRARVVDRFTVWREGAQAVWLDPGGVRVVSDRAWRGARPWVPPPVPRGVAEPMAPTE